mmetsp:Transcript_36992/g.80848  ORF Transcript_36992/g.80848 Transcript_36992/m.80848 type:complete len:226 (-) Transcript_36992:7-684(-)
MNMLPIFDGRLAQGHVHIASNLVHRHVSMHLAADSIPALLRRVQDVIIRQLGISVSILESLAGVAAFVIIISCLHAGHALPSFRLMITLGLLAGQAQIHLMEATLDVHLILANSIHSVNRNFIAAQVRESDIQANRQLFGQRGIHQNVVHDLHGQERVELRHKQKSHQHHGTDRQEPTAGGLHLILIMQLGKDIELPEVPAAVRLFPWSLPTFTHGARGRLASQT